MVLENWLSHPRQRCTCGGDLALTGEIREGAWRVGFRLTCRQCGKKWKYTRGFYAPDPEEG